MTLSPRKPLPLSRHPGESRGPGASGKHPPCGPWIPAFAGMTTGGLWVRGKLTESRSYAIFASVCPSPRRGYIRNLFLRP